MRAWMRACLNHPANRAPAAAWADLVSLPVGREAWSSSSRPTSSGRSRTVRADSAFSVCRRLAAPAVIREVVAISRTEAAGMGYTKGQPGAVQARTRPSAASGG